MTLSHTTIYFPSIKKEANRDKFTLRGCSTYFQDQTWQKRVMALKTGHCFWLCVSVYCNLDLGDITLGQGHDTPLRSLTAIL